MNSTVIAVTSIRTSRLADLTPWVIDIYQVRSRKVNNVLQETKLPKNWNFEPKSPRVVLQLQKNEKR